MTAPAPDLAERPLATAGVAITDEEFGVFRDLVHEYTGIALCPYKRYLVQARLARRLRALGVATFSDYHRYLCESDPDGQELRRLINAMTTNKTEFFREGHHFAFLREQWAPARCASPDRVVRFWSAGCSTGEEPYTLAMTLLDTLDGGGRAWDVRILASDIDTDVLARAQEGVYARAQVAAVPRAMLRRYFLRGRARCRGLVRVRPALADLVAFRRINVVDDPWPVRTRFDGIFCRNVLIYFDRPTQQRILGRLVRYLKEDGLLFLGHSESARGLLDDVRPVGPTIYRRV